MASGFLWIYLGMLLLMVVGFMAVGAGVGGAIGGRGALVGLIAGVLIGPPINNALFFTGGPPREPGPIVIDQN
jgi:hypothetical protein